MREEQHNVVPFPLQKRGARTCASCLWKCNDHGDNCDQPEIANLMANWVTSTKLCRERKDLCGPSGSRWEACE